MLAAYIGDRSGRSASEDAAAADDLQQHPAGTFLLTDRACWTANGRVGICGTVRQCYPNVRLPQLSNLETWVLGSRGTCNYVENDGRQVLPILINSLFF